jgi:ABC-type amino acid transport substrate-binding protein
LIVTVRQPQSPRGTFFDPAHLQTRGLEVALARAIAKELLGDETQTQVEFRSGPATAVIRTVLTGQVDLGLATVVGFPTDDALRQQVAVSDPFAIGGIAIAIKQGGVLGSLGKLDGKKVAVPQTGSRDHRTEFDSLAKQQGLNILIENYPDMNEAAAAIESGQVQAVVSHSIPLAAYIQQNPGRLALADVSLTNESFGIAVPKDAADLLYLVNAVLRGLKGSGQLKSFAQETKFPIESLAAP